MASVCTLGDVARTTAPHDHNCPACPHMCEGPAISASGNVRIGGRPALRVGDTGVHSSCCGPNTWVVAQGSGQLMINGAAAVRVGDKTRHCSISNGKMITGHASVADGSSTGEPVNTFRPEDIPELMSNILQLRNEISRAVVTNLESPPQNMGPTPPQSQGGFGGSSQNQPPQQQQQPPAHSVGPEDTPRIMSNLLQVQHDMMEAVTSNRRSGGNDDER